MILLNFGQKLRDIQFEQFNSLTSLKITEQIMLPIESLTEEDIHKRLNLLFLKVKLTDEELQREKFVIVPPPHSVVAIKVIGDLYQRTKSFPYVIKTASSVFGMSSGPMVEEVMDLEKLFGTYS
jgi:hypothetical protein